ncbi:MAG: crossover junction endodeoxyribonuclease RuvC [Candidatus Omnitrophica bacterium]|nr:crossover junction endodeoxyribonuclease RuvC [Candidatus Omnitrophota bacterium]
MRILSVDIGLYVTGYVICEVDNLKISLIKEDEIKTARYDTFSKKLNYIFECLENQIQIFKPEAVLLERLYSHYRHPITFGILAQIRGVVVLLTERKNLKLFEFSPTKAKKSILGKGNSKSFQVKKMAENITGHTFKSNHTADAFSLVIAFSHMQKINKLEIFFKYDFKN